MTELELAGFDEFWTAYPRKQQKISAARMYKRVLKMTNATQIIRAAKLYAQERAGKEHVYTKLPATWLNSGAWDDYPEEAEPKPIEGFYAEFCSAELDAWHAYYRKTTGLNCPVDRRGGWLFPTRWPPDLESKEAR